MCDSQHPILQTAPDLIAIERPHLEADIQVFRAADLVSSRLAPEPLLAPHSVRYQEPSKRSSRSDLALRVRVTPWPLCYGATVWRPR